MQTPACRYKRIFGYKIMRLFYILLLFTLCAKSQVTIYSENFGSTVSFISASTYTGYQHYGEQTYTGSASIRNTLPSTGYAGASGAANVFFTNVAGTSLTVSGINTYCYLFAFLSVGIWKSTTASNGSEFIIEYSDNGGAWVQMPFTLPTGTGTAIWRNVTLADYLPLTTNLALRFRQTSSSGVQFRIDDINVAGIQNATDTFISNCSGFYYGGEFYTHDSLYIFTEYDYRGCDSLIRVEYEYNPNDPSCLLPVELVWFHGGCDLTWQTASEYDVAHFAIEIWNDGWHEIDRVSAGTSIITKNYRLNAAPGIYRLKIVDINGRYEYAFPVIVRDCNSKEIYYNILGQQVNHKMIYK
jgi:hypothetical protein